LAVHEACGASVVRLTYPDLPALGSFRLSF
jgi:hypothetical protein